MVADLEIVNTPTNPFLRSGELIMRPTVYSTPILQVSDASQRGVCMCAPGVQVGLPPGRNLVGITSFVAQPVVLRCKIQHLALRFMP